LSLLTLITVLAVVHAGGKGFKGKGFKGGFRGGFRRGFGGGFVGGFVQPQPIFIPQTKFIPQAIPQPIPVPIYGGSRSRSRTRVFSLGPQVYQV
jgi:hypothetical protein